ncbi:hypothetical protein E2C01_094887 [Portunus trituberculatus]|uniref:Uncharacterized protein n=1 Tax=Portunus trituberculatus TaxID=210409 RepID=A0A5B7JTP2_PORTR|nr:hypothetical protein [Portunus trituberculatus]
MQVDRGYDTREGARTVIPSPHHSVTPYLINMCCPFSPHTISDYNTFFTHYSFPISLPFETLPTPSLLTCPWYSPHSLTPLNPSLPVSSTPPSQETRLFRPLLYEYQQRLSVCLSELVSHGEIVSAGLLESGASAGPLQTRN